MKGDAGSNAELPPAFPGFQGSLEPLNEIIGRNWGWTQVCASPPSIVCTCNATSESDNRATCWTGRDKKQIKPF